MSIRVNTETQSNDNAKVNVAGSGTRVNTGGNNTVSVGQKPNTKIKVNGKSSESVSEDTTVSTGQSSQPSQQQGTKAKAKTESDASFSSAAEAIAAAEQAAAAREAARNEKLAREKDKKIAQDTVQAQRERGEQTPRVMPAATVGTATNQEQVEQASTPAVRPSVSAADVAASAGAASDVSANQNQLFNDGSNQLFDENLAADIAQFESPQSSTIPTVTAEQVQQQQASARPDGIQSQDEQVPLDAYGMPEEQQVDTSGNTVNTQAAKTVVNRGRYNSPSEIQEQVASYVGTPAGSDYIFNFADDAAFETKRYNSNVTDEQVMKNVIREAQYSGEDITDDGKAKRSSDTSYETQKTGNVEFNPDETVEDNIRNVDRSIKSTIDFLLNPLLIKIEGSRLNRRAVEGNNRQVDVTFEFANEEGRDVQGALGSIRRVYGCSMMDALRMVYIRLGLGVDSHGKICGKSVEDFVLPSVMVIEAANDIVNSQMQYGTPNAIVKGKRGGFSNSRDDSGMFPVLGGTRCYPMGYIPKFIFDGLAEDIGSPFHNMSFEAFATRCAEVFLNDTQPRILANTEGHLGWQATALGRMMDALSTIDGVDPWHNLPSSNFYRTKAKIDAELEEAGDPAIIEALEVKDRVLPEAVNRWAFWNYKNKGSRTNATSDLPAGTYVGPGEKQDHRGNPVERFFREFTSLEAAAHVIRIPLMITGVVENAVATAQQQVVVSFQNGYKKHLEKKWGADNRFDKTEYLESVMGSDDALEAIEVYQTLMRIGGRTAIDAFRYDREKGSANPQYKATKADMNAFLKRWGANQSSEIKQKIERAISFAMFGDGMFNRTKAQQFLDMALYENARNFHGSRASYSSSQLEEIARSGQYRKGQGEALVSALMDSDAGYEAFITLGNTGLGRINPWSRATRAVLQKNGITDAVVKHTIGMFPEYGINKLMRILPATNTVSFLISHVTKKASLSFAEQVDLSTKFGENLHDAAAAIGRISDYQMGMNSDFITGLSKNIAYDVVSFGGNYILTSLLCRVVMAALGGIEPPDDDDKITLPEEWVIKGLGVPIKMAWFMDDLLGCGLPLAYAWEIAEGGWRDRDPNDWTAEGTLVEGWSDKALSVASSAFINAVSGTLQGNFVVDAIDFVNNFQKNIDEIANWSTNSVEEMRKYYGDDDESMSESELRREWIDARAEGILWDLFNTMTPAIINEIFPGSRDSFWDDGYTHTTRKGFDTDNYDLDTAKKEYRVKDLAYRDAERCRKTQDNVLGALIADLLDTRDGIEYQYANMPIDTTLDPRSLAGESFTNLFSIPLELDNGSKNLDLNNDGKQDTREERQSYLFNRAEEVCKYINDHYILTNGYPELAVADGFVVPLESRVNAINYCHYMIGSKSRKGKLITDFDDWVERRKAEVGWIENTEYQAAYENMQSEIQKYTDILYNYLSNEDIPWRAPRYAHLSTDRNTMYVDSKGNATNILDPNAQAVTYDYGNQPSGVLPFTSPRDTGLNDYNSMLWDVMLDENGEPINDMGRIYDQAAAAGNVAMGRWKDNNVLNMFTNDHVLGRDDILNLGSRAYETLEATYPEILKDPTADTIAKILGIDCYIAGEETITDSDDNKDSDKNNNNNNNNGYNNYSGNYGGGYNGGYGGGYSSRRSYYSYGGGGGGSSYSSYNPKIYSTSKQVYTQRASGMGTHQPYKATSTYLRPSFYTKGSREAYKRSDF